MIDKFVTYINTLDQVLFLSIMVYMLLAIIIGSIATIIIKSIKYRKKKKNWLKDVKIGDQCNLSLIDNSTLLHNLEIIDIKDDKFTVKIEISKRFIYPPTNT